MLLEGLHIPLTTPFHPDGRLNPHKLAANVARYSKTPAAGLIILGPQGEPTLLSDEETHETLRTAASAVAPEKLLIAGISRDSVRSTLALADFAADQRYDAVLVGAPCFLSAEHMSYRLNANFQVPPLPESRLTELRTFFQAIADRSPLPVILLSLPGRTISLSIARQVSIHPNIVGFYGAGASMKVHQTVIASLLAHTLEKKREVTVTHTFAAVTARMKHAPEPAPALISARSLTDPAAAIAESPPAAPTLRTRTKTIGFQIISRNSAFLLDALNAGATAIAPAFAASAPQACYEVFAAWKDSDQPLAEEKQARLNPPALLTESNPGLLKFSCDLNGYFGGVPRLPHLPPTGDQRAALQALMQGIRT